jgi:acetyl coenzyme A synthetase (ADP forming)-like protein
MAIALEGVEVVLRDGSTVHVRPVTATDIAALRAFLEALSPNSRRLRYFSGGANLDAEARSAADVTRPDGYGVVATRGDGRLVAHAGYVRLRADRAEVAFAVADELHGMGIATTLLAHLAETAEEDGIAWFEAEVLPENHAMIEVFRESGFAVETHSGPGYISFEFPTTLSESARERFEERDRVAACAAVRSILEPASVAVIGASRRPRTVGNAVLRNLVEGDFAGPVYPVNPHARSVQAVPAFASVADVPGRVELAVVAVPASAVVGVARECAAKGVRALVVLSAGFAESGDEGAARQRELLGVCRDAGMRLVGPNCLGVMNTTGDVRLNASFAPTAPAPGRVGFLSQSGALGLAIVDHARALGLGLSSFVSNGNKADVSGNDLIQYWEQDEHTDLAVLYLESFGNARKFSRLARRVGRVKPIVAVKSGRSAAGAKAAGSHTGALVSASDGTVDALFRQAGVIRTDTLSELFDVSELLAARRAPRGRRVGIVTNAGGLAILCADACDSAGLSVPELPEAVRGELSGFLPATAATANPVDMIATATAAHYRNAVKVVGASGAVDAVIAIFIPPLVTRADDVAAAIAAAAAELGDQVPVLAVFASDGRPAALAEGELKVPAYTYPENAARALGKAAAYGEWLGREEGSPPAFEDAHPDEAAAVLARALERGPGWLAPAEVTRLLGAWRFPLPASRVVRTAAEAAAAAAEMGGEVALKAVAPGLLHKSDAGGVKLGLRSEAVADAVEEMRTALDAAGYRPEAFLVQGMAPSGVEMLVGVVHDPVFGPVVACGGGGTTAELTGDVAVRLTPLSDRDADEMIRSLRAYGLLEGYRGAPRADIGALRDVVLRLAALVQAHPAVAEVDLNPVVAGTGGAVVVDARVRVVEPAPRRPWPAIGS